MPTRAAPTSDSRQLAMENTSLFGGLALVMMSDFDQLPPVTGPSLSEQIMALALSGDVVPVDSSAAESAVVAFKTARTFFLTEQKR